MSEILSARKNRGNVTFRLTLSEKSEGVLVHLEKLMKVRSSEQGKKTTKKTVYEHTFYARDLQSMKAIINDDEMYSFCLEQLEALKNDN